MRCCCWLRGAGARDSLSGVLPRGGTPRCYLWLSAWLVCGCVCGCVCVCVFACRCRRRMFHVKQFEDDGRFESRYGQVLSGCWAGLGWVLNNCAGGARRCLCCPPGEW